MKKHLWIVFYILMLVVCIGHEVFADTPTQIEFLVGGATDSSGDPLAGGKVYTYQAGTTTPKATYQDAAKATPHANPVVLDAEGKKQVFADGNYKLRIDNSADTTQYTLDNMKYGQYSGASSYAGPTTGAANAYVATLSPALLAYDNGAVITFTANHTNSGASTLNVNGLGAKTLYSAEATAMTTFSILAGHTYTFVYSTAQNGWLLVESDTNSGPTTFTTTLVPSAGTVSAQNTVYAKYSIHGNKVFFSIYVQFTQNTSTATSMTFQGPPTSLPAALHSLSFLAAYDGSALVTGAAYINTSGGVTLFPTSGWTAGASRSLIVSGFYFTS